MSERQTRSYLDGSVLKIMAPIMSERGDQAIAATVVHLPAERFLEAIRRNLRLAGVVPASGRRPCGLASGDRATRRARPALADDHVNMGRRSISLSHPRATR